VDSSRPTRPPQPSRRGRGGRPSPLGKTTTDDGGALTDLGCPDCTGVLAFRRMEGQLSFTCSVGHAFSVDSLIEAKEQELETALWGGVELYLELAVIHRELSRQARADGDEAVARAGDDRVAKAEEFSERLRQVLAGDGITPQPGDP
jgi:two-component system chemotaxis response regulator CheB